MKMKYFTSNLWASLNSRSKEQRISAEKQWDDAFVAYQKQWNHVRRHLPDNFRKFYENHPFHDAPITQCIFEYREKEPTIRMKLLIDERPVDLCFLNVDSFHISLIDFSNCILNQLAWGYDEFEYLPTRQFKLSVLCDINNEIEIVFKKLEWELLK